MKRKSPKYGCSVRSTHIPYASPHCSRDSDGKAPNHPSSSTTATYVDGVYEETCTMLAPIASVLTKC
jgi:hypothetical protein